MNTENLVTPCAAKFAPRQDFPRSHLFHHQNTCYSNPSYHLFPHDASQPLPCAHFSTYLSHHVVPHLKLSPQASAPAEEFALKAMNGLFDMIANSFKPPSAHIDNSDLVWCTNLAEAVAERGKARELAAKLRLQDAEQAEKDLLEAVHEGIDE